MKEKRLSAEEAKDLWEKVVEDLVTPISKSIDMSTIKEKLKKVRFGVGGQMKQFKTRRDEIAGKTDKWWIYANYKFSSLVREFNKRKLELELELENV